MPQPPIYRPVIPSGEKGAHTTLTEKPGQGSGKWHFMHKHDIGIDLRMDALTLPLDVKFPQSLVRVDTQLAQIGIPPGDIDPSNFRSPRTCKPHIDVHASDARRAGAVIKNGGHAVFTIFPVI